MDTMGSGVQERNKVAFSRNIGCRKNRGIARDLLYAEPELGAGHSQLSLLKNAAHFNLFMHLAAYNA
jgi:hypothetical protein